MPLFNHFDFLAPMYEFFIQPKIPETLSALAGLPVPGAVLDAGGGTGRVAQFLSGKAAQVVVVDQSLEMLREVRKKDGLRPACSLTERLPFRDHTFERIVMVDALHHVLDQVQTAAELWRILAPGGRIVIEEPNIASLRVKLVALAEKLALMRSHFLAPAQIGRLFRSPEARVRFHSEKTTAWVIIDKAPWLL